MKIIDISRGIGSDMRMNPERRGISGMETYLDAATHVNSPSYIFPDESDIASLRLEPCIGNCQVVSIDEPPITGAETEIFVPFDCTRVLFKCEHGAFLHESAAYVLARDGVKLVGVDSPKIGGGIFDKEVYKALLSYNVAVIENLDLSNVVPGNYFLFAPPLKVERESRALCRAVLIDNRY